MTNLSSPLPNRTSPLIAGTATPEAATGWVIVTPAVDGRQVDRHVLAGRAAGRPAMEPLLVTDVT